MNVESANYIVTNDGVWEQLATRVRLVQCCYIEDFDDPEAPGRKRCRLRTWPYEEPLPEGTYLFQRCA